MSRKPFSAVKPFETFEFWQSRVSEAIAQPEPLNRDSTLWGVRKLTLSDILQQEVGFIVQLLSTVGDVVPCSK